MKSLGQKNNVSTPSSKATPSHQMQYFNINTLEQIKYNKIFSKPQQVIRNTANIFSAVTV